MGGGSNMMGDQLGQHSVVSKIQPLVSYYQQHKTLGHKGWRVYKTWFKKNTISCWKGDRLNSLQNSHVDQLSYADQLHDTSIYLCLYQLLTLCAPTSLQFHLVYPATIWSATHPLYPQALADAMGQCPSHAGPQRLPLPSGRHVPAAGRTLRTPR